MTSADRKRSSCHPGQGIIQGHPSGTYLLPLQDTTVSQIHASDWGPSKCSHTWVCGNISHPSYNTDLPNSLRNYVFNPVWILVSLAQAPGCLLVHTLPRRSNLAVVIIHVYVSRNSLQSFKKTYWVGLTHLQIFLFHVLVTWAHLHRDGYTALIVYITFNFIQESQKRQNFGKYKLEISLQTLMWDVLQYMCCF